MKLKSEFNTKSEWIWYKLNLKSIKQLNELADKIKYKISGNKKTRVRQLYTLFTAKINHNAIMKR